MKLPKLLLSVVLLLVLGAFGAGAATIGGLYVYGSGSGTAVVVGNGSEYHQVMADVWNPNDAYNPSFSITGMEMESYCGGAGSGYNAQCGLSVGPGESVTVSYFANSSYNGTAVLRIGSAFFFSGQSGTLVLGPGNYDLQTYVSGSYSNDSADADIIVYTN
jgi:hypothetical protein